jgi:ABC-type phosphonate transport system ATPase subunit
MHFSLPFVTLTHDLAVYRILLDCVILMTVGDEVQLISTHCP